ncbi:D-alanine--D-alanine ligase [Liberibacter crescens BT-1]|uniref:D-alanine--D-alanine ligase n=1 Tax=Liberibacter crescens (strain BT-1) TaxID=1215343 RepID=L0EW40_LIBCB|nr:D-alanine--D-alanine ligase [Liberibacter crescens]AGA64586.1 D-alanine--D-alanine ligase [Liberibacter crescens BT-1]AMC12718.1 D-alanine--D-alanine ligase [Liberibacter crescens]
MKIRHVAILMGGFSSERLISFSSGETCAVALEEAGFEVSRVNVNRSVAEVLVDLKPDIALNVLHGAFGEDGILQGILEYLQIPYTYSGVLASALAMDKVRAKQIVSSQGISVAPSIVVNRRFMCSEHVMPPPYVIKPLKGGSSLGVLIVRKEDAVPLHVINSPEWDYGDEILVEKYIDGIELTCGVMGDKALDVVEIVPVGQDFYNYDAKYKENNCKHILPARIPSDIYEKIRTLSLKAHKIIGCRGISRSDFIFNNITGEIIWLEINTQPGMTPTSLIPEMALHSGYSFGELLQWILKDASCLR